MIKLRMNFFRKKPLLKLSIFLPAVVVFVHSCSKDPELAEAIDDNISFVVPPGFPQPVYDFSNNPVTKARFELGRKLFYEPALSRDNAISCGSCHQQFAAFAHFEHDFSHGVDGLLGTRNAPGLFNLAWHTRFMHDGGINHIESQPIAPIENPVEMDETLPSVLAKLQARPVYRTMFAEAFGDDSITTQRMSQAIVQFMGLMISADSKYDKYRAGTATFTAQEQAGLATFRSKCASCHTEPLFMDNGFRNNGLAIDPTINDSGRAHITGDPADMYTFKTPSLRNITLTGPYMHDGRFVTLQECLDHYSSGVVNSSTLDPLIGPSGIPLTAQEKSDLLAFLATLTDNTFARDPRFKEGQ
ncbi:MAG: cytochrome-c peroxidase [Bacteroidia bacterium]